MEFEPFSRDEVVECMEANGTRQSVIDRFVAAVGRKKVEIAADGTWTVLRAGGLVGPAKRTTHPRRRDEDNFIVAVSVAAARMIEDVV
jgi:hypothetical protein